MSHYGFNEDRSKVEIYSKEETDQLMIPVQSASGESVVTHGCALYSVDAEGWAEQVSTVGKNLLNVSPISATNNGETIASNGDGSFIASGNPTTSFYMSFMSSVITLQAGTYTLSVSGLYTTSDGTKTLVRLRSADNSSNIVSVTFSAKSASFTVAEETEMFLVFFTTDTVSLAGEILVQLESGSTATAYEPYTGGAPSPSPDYPQEIRVARGHEIAGQTGRYVDLIVKDVNDVVLSTTPIPLPSKGWTGALPDGTADTLAVDSAGRYEWTAPTVFTTQAVTDGVSGTVGVDVMSSTGQIADGATVLYASTPVVEHGYIDVPAIPDGSTVSIPELGEIGVAWFVAGAAELVEHAKNWHKREDLEGRVEALEAIVAELATE